MIKKPTLKPKRGFTEVEANGKRMYRNIKTGQIVEPGSEIAKTEQLNENKPPNGAVTWDELAEAYEKGVNSIE